MSESVSLSVSHPVTFRRFPHIHQGCLPFLSLRGVTICEGLRNLSCRHSTVLFSRDQREGRLRAAVRSGEKAGTSKSESMPASPGPILRSIALGMHADGRAGDRRPEEESTRKHKRPEEESTRRLSHEFHEVRGLLSLNSLRSGGKFLVVPASKYTQALSFSDIY